uniref:Uncharacterized protein n=1 Tax=Anopheles atroparvus TaxID=41427 RepID=A0AAG5D9L9_ANOAO
MTSGFETMQPCSTCKHNLFRKKKQMLYAYL